MTNILTHANTYHHQSPSWNADYSMGNDVTQHAEVFLLLKYHFSDDYEATGILALTPVYLSVNSPMHPSIHQHENRSTENSQSERKPQQRGKCRLIE